MAHLYIMPVPAQTCSISKQHNGRVIYLKPRISAAIAKYFPLSRDAPFDYKVEFDEETETLTIRKDI